MKRWIGLMAAGLMLAASTVVTAQPGPGGGLGGPGGPMMRMGMPGQVPPTEVDELVVVVADLNLRPGFTLSEDQKVKVQAIRDELKASQDKWREENAEELKQINETMASLREAGPSGDWEAWRDVMEQNMALMETAPNGEAEAQKIREVLTKEQAAALEVREAEIDAERQKMWEQMGGPGRGPGGPGGQRGPRQGGPQGQGGQGGGPGQGGNRPGI